MSGHEVKERFMPMFNATLPDDLRACGGGACKTWRPRVPFLSSILNSLGRGKCLLGFPGGGVGTRATPREGDFQRRMSGITNLCTVKG